MATVCSAPDCGQELPPATGNRPRLYCNSSCRRKAHEARKAQSETVATLPEPKTVTLVDAVRQELAEADRLGTVEGQQAVLLAERMVNGGTTASSVASLNKELNAVRARALAGTKPRQTDALDELEQRRAQKAAGA